MRIERYLYGKATVVAADATKRYLGIGDDGGMEIFDRLARRRKWVAWVFDGGRLPTIAPAGEFVVLLRDDALVHMAPGTEERTAPCFGRPVERFDGEALAVSADGYTVWATRYVHAERLLEIHAFDADSLDLIERVEVRDDPTISGELDLTAGCEGSQVVLSCNIGDGHAGMHFLEIADGGIERVVHQLHDEALFPLGFSSDGKTFFTKDYYESCRKWSWPSCEPQAFVKLDLARDFYLESVDFADDRFYGLICDPDSYEPIGIAEVLWSSEALERRIHELPVDLGKRDDRWLIGASLWARRADNYRSCVMGIGDEDGVAPGELANPADRDELWRLYAVYGENARKFEFELRTATRGYLEKLMAVHEGLVEELSVAMEKLGVDRDGCFMASERLTWRGAEAVAAFLEQPTLEAVDPRPLDEDAAIFAVSRMAEQFYAADEQALGDLE